MPKRKTQKKKKGFNIDMICIILICIGIFLCIITYSNSGIVGEEINSILGGFLGNTRYFLPFVLIILGIYVVFRDKDSLIRKSMQYTGLFISLAAIMNIFSANLNNNDQFFKQFNNYIY